MKRVVAVILMASAIALAFRSVEDFDNAKNGLQLFKAIFWMVIGFIAFYGFMDNFKKNKWPFV